MAQSAMCLLYNPEGLELVRILVSMCKPGTERNRDRDTETPTKKRQRQTEKERERKTPTEKRQTDP